VVDSVKSRGEVKQAAPALDQALDEALEHLTTIGRDQHVVVQSSHHGLSAVKLSVGMTVILASGRCCRESAEVESGRLSPAA